MTDTDQPMDAASSLLDIRDLTVHLPGPHGTENQILDKVNMRFAARTTSGIIGESGSGKSMTALAVLGLLPKHARVEGQILFDGVDLLKLAPHDLRPVRGKQISMIFQEPMTSLDAVFTIGYQISQVYREHFEASREEAKEETIAMLDAVGIPDPRRRFGEYPHQLSGGMRQRAMIAMALICRPRLLIADEPTTALDITIQAQILDLLQQLSDDTSTAIVLISHDIGVVSEVCSWVDVMYAGQVVESRSTDNLLERPAHPYTSGLMWAVPRIETRGQELYSIPGRVPRPGEMPRGCRFSPRCSHVRASCVERAQVLTRVSFDGAAHLARCERADELELPGIDDPSPVQGADKAVAR
ncbi:ABC transporter ATP-binding protein [Blastococcus sp. SYSU DS1024]